MNTQLEVFFKEFRKISGIDPIKRDYSAAFLSSDPAESTSSVLTKKDQVINAILRRGFEVGVDDLPATMEEMKSFFETYKNSNYFEDINSKSYYRLLDLRDNADVRVVVIGDIHCDYYSLAALLLKLSVSEYDYFENGYFVFLGDYLDRGSALFEPLLLLIDLKEILGDRLIMLRGNHELIRYDEEKQMLESSVLPQQTCPCLNEYCGEDKAFLKAFGYFYQTLPTYVYLKVANQNLLLTHAAVPRMIFFDKFHYDQATGAIEFEPNFILEQLQLSIESTTDDSLSSMRLLFDKALLKYRNQILYDMIWGDPSHEKEKFQISGRFEFGSSQFEPYASKNNISRIFRSHEPISGGFESFYEGQLYTIFSTGGDMNDQAGYADVNPAFAVIKGDGSYMIENSYDYRVTTGQVATTINNLFSGEFLVARQVGALSLNEEFSCSDEEALRIEAFFERVKQGFTPQEGTGDAEAPIENETINPV